MFALIRKKSQVLRSIILFIFKTTHRIFCAFMMNNLFRVKKTTYNFLHNKDSSFNISSIISSWMIRFKDKNISICVFRLSIFPIPMILSSWRKLMTLFKWRCWFVPFFKTTFCRWMTFFEFSFIRYFSHFLFMIFSSYINSAFSFSSRHFILHIKKAAFRYLREQRLSYSTLRPPIKHKNTATLLGNLSIAN